MDCDMIVSIEKCENFTHMLKLMLLCTMSHAVVMSGFSRTKSCWSSRFHTRWKTRWQL